MMLLLTYLFFLGRPTDDDGYRVDDSKRQTETKDSIDRYINTEPEIKKKDAA